MGSLLMRLRGLSPFGPIFGKELRVTARRKRTYVLRFLYLGALFLLMLFVYSVSRWESPGGGVARRAQQMAELGAVFFGVFSFFTWAAMGLVGPVLTSTAINSERLHKTLPVLLMTPITAWQIVAGKLFSRLLIALTLIGLSLPVLAVVRLLGGVEIEQMFAVVCLCITTVITTASIGLLFSTLMNRPYAVILLSYGTLLLFWALIPIIVAMIVTAETWAAPLERFLFALTSLTLPWFAVVLAFMPMRPPFSPVAWYWCVALYLGISAVLLVVSALILRRRARKDDEGGRPAAPPGVPASAPAADEDSAPAPSDGLCAAPPAQLPRSPASSVSDNPVLWRELRRRLVAKRWQAVALTLLLLALLGAMYMGMGANDVLDDEEPQIAFAIIFCGMLTVLVCILSATAIAQEKESDTWTLLLATPLSAAGIVWGKMAGLLRRLIWPSAIIIAHFCLFTIGGVINLPTLLVILWLTFTTNLIWIATGLYLSLRLKTVTFAVILNLLLPLIAYGGVALVAGILGEMLDPRGDWEELSMTYAPYAYMGSVIDDYNSLYSYSWSSAPLPPQVWMPMAGRQPAATVFTAIFFVGCGYILASLAIVGYTIRRFNAIVGRAGQATGASTPLSAPALSPAAE